MYSEMIKIIEGGLSGDKNRVYSYSKKLIEELEKENEKLLAKKINRIIEEKKTTMAVVEQFSGKPVDQESRMDMVQIDIPKENKFIGLDNRTENEINDFIDIIKSRNELLRRGINENMSMLLYGYPGCGKTSIAELISNRLQLPLVTVRFDTIISSLLGSTSKNIRKVFEYASSKPCILFLDEFDVVAKARDDKNEVGELKRVVNTLIQNMDLYINNGGVLIAATNHEELLDTAIWRRFGYVLEINKPLKKEIEKFIKQLIKQYKFKIDKENKISRLSESFDGMSYAEIKKVIMSVIKKAIINNQNYLNYIDIIYEIYLHKKMDIRDEEELIKFLRSNEVTQLEINQKLNISLRKIREIEGEN